MLTTIHRMTLKMTIDLSALPQTQDDACVNELAKSIMLHGLSNPPTILLTQNGFQIHSGRKRIAALRRLGVLTTPIVLAIGFDPAERIIDD